MGAFHTLSSDIGPNNDSATFDTSNVNSMLGFEYSVMFFANLGWQ
jgi:hypothetical protein